MEESPFNRDELIAQTLAGGGPRGGERHSSLHAGAASTLLRATALYFRCRDRYRRVAACDPADRDTRIRAVTGS